MIPYSEKLKNTLRGALLLIIFWKAYVGGTKLWVATVNNNNFVEESNRDAFYVFNIMTPTEWVCLGTALCTTILATVVGFIWLAVSGD
jgi:hypothetical protein